MDKNWGILYNEAKVVDGKSYYAIEYAESLQQAYNLMIRRMSETVVGVRVIKIMDVQDFELKPKEKK